MRKVQVILAVILLACFLPMPYGFYTLVRFVSMIGFAWMSYQYYAFKKTNLAVLFGSLALLFQPFFKIALGRTLWNMVDLIVAIVLIVLCLKGKNQK